VRGRCYTVATSGPAVDLWPTCFTWSGWRDSNPRPLAPKASALPNCATPRCAPTGAHRSLRDHQDPCVAPPQTSAEKLAAGTLEPLRHGGACGRSSMVEPQPSKLAMPVRSRSPAPQPSPAKMAVRPDHGKSRSPSVPLGSIRKVTFARLAVTPEQIEELSLPTRPTKTTHTRAKNFTGGREGHQRPPRRRAPS
jgi:hypothetical protein